MADPKGGRPPELLNRWTRAEETSQAAAQEGQVSPVVEMEREGAGEGVQARPHREGEQDLKRMYRVWASNTEETWRSCCPALQGALAE